MRSFIILIFVALMSACASTERTPEQIAASKAARKVCSEEAPTGSLRKRSRCRSAAQIQKEREAAQEAMRNRTSLSTSVSQ